jgi:membrane-bound ClpP family serine protease
MGETKNKKVRVCKDCKNLKQGLILFVAGIGTFLIGIFSLSRNLNWDMNTAMTGFETMAFLFSGVAIFFAGLLVFYSGWRGR